MSIKIICSCNEVHLELEISDDFSFQDLKVPTILCGLYLMLFYCTEKYCSAQNIYLFTIVSPLVNESTQIHQIINIKRLWKENLSKLGVIYFQNDNRIMSGSMFGAVAIEQSSSRFHNYRWSFISNQNLSFPPFTNQTVFWHRNY